mgnify:CR=1 FL=1
MPEYTMQYTVAASVCRIIIVMFLPYSGVDDDLI